MKRIYIIVLFLLLAALSAAQTRYAFLIGIGQYPADSGWSTIHGDNDVALLRPPLMELGFQECNIVSLVNESATKESILTGLKSLREQAQLGDIIYIHFSGHGQQVTDLDGDETDHFDEAWIPYDAKKRYEAGIYEGQNHILDDEINLYLNGLRSKVGPKGKIVVVSDACHSGSGSRGLVDADEPIRGTSEKFVIPASLPNVIRKEAPIHWLFVGACKPYQTNHEYKTAEGHFYGSLTFAIVDSNGDPVASDYRDVLSLWRITLANLSRYPQDMDDEGKPSKHSLTMF